MTNTEYRRLVRKANRKKGSFQEMQSSITSIGKIPGKPSRDLVEAHDSNVTVQGHKVENSIARFRKNLKYQMQSLGQQLFNQSSAQEDRVKQEDEAKESYFNRFKDVASNMQKNVRKSNERTLGKVRGMIGDLRNQKQPNLKYQKSNSTYIEDALKDEQFREAQMLRGNTR